MKKSFIIFGVLTSLQLKAEINLGPCDVAVATALLDFWNNQTPINAEKQNFRVIKGKIVYKNNTPLISKETSDSKQIYVYKDGQGIKRKIEISRANDEIIVQKTNNTQVTDKIIDARSGKETSIGEQVFPPDQGYIYYKFKAEDNRCILDQYGDTPKKNKTSQITTVIYDRQYCIKTNALTTEHCNNQRICSDIYFVKIKELYDKRSLELKNQSQAFEALPDTMVPAIKFYDSCRSDLLKKIGVDQFTDPLLKDDLYNGKLKEPNPNTRKKATI